MGHIHQTLRSLGRARGFAFSVVVTLTLGLWATTAMFSVVNAVMLRPLPLPDADRLVRIWEAKPSENQRRSPVSQGNFVDWKQRAASFEGLFIADGGFEKTVLTVGHESEQVRGVSVTPDAFAILGVAPARGGGFRAGREGARDIVVSDGLWRRRFNADPNVIGSVVSLEGRAQYTVVGVMPPGFAFPDGTELWTPLTLESAPRRGGRFHDAYGRLKPSVTLSQARAEMATIARGAEQEFPDTNRGWTIEVDSLLDATVGGHKTALSLLLGAVGLVLLVVCANVASMVTVRSLSTRSEVALRLALGATPRAIMRQAMLESLVLASIAGVGALLLLALTLPVMRTLGAGIIPRMQDVRIDLSVVLFVFVLMPFSALLFGLALAIRLLRTDPSPLLKSGLGSSGVSGRRSAFAGLTIVECALATILLVGAMLLVQSFSRLAGADAGFNPSHVLALDLRVPALCGSYLPARRAMKLDPVAALRSE